MLESVLQWFVTPGFMPHSYCLLKNPAIMTLHVASDGVISLAYFSIPIALANFVRRRKDLVFSETFILFAAFILSCGTTHILDIWTLWQPDYLLQGLVKALTAGISLITAVLIWPVLQKALALPSPSQLAAVNEELSREASAAGRAAGYGKRGERAAAARNTPARKRTVAENRVGHRRRWHPHHRRAGPH